MQPLRVTMGRALSPEERRNASVFISMLYPPGHRGRLGPGRSAAWSRRIGVPHGVPCFVIPRAGTPGLPLRHGQAWLLALQRWGGARSRDPARTPPTCAHGSRGSASTGGRFLPPDLTGSAHRRGEARLGAPSAGCRGNCSCAMGWGGEGRGRREKGGQGGDWGGREEE